jgi:methanogenic corrinoid protein MtbC1
MKAALEILEPALAGDQKREVAGTIVLGTVEGDLHEIGKSLVGTMLTANDFKVIDNGVDKPAPLFIDAVKESGANLVGASALLTTTMLQQEKLFGALKEAGLREQVMLMVGGAPVIESYAKQIGADGYAEDAIAAVDLAMRLIDDPAKQTISQEKTQYMQYIFPHSKSNIQT